MDGTTQQFLLVICDISGYTRFMTERHEARLHSYAVVTELMNAVLSRAGAPLEVAKLEGDAVFMYAVHETGPSNHPEQIARAVMGRLDAIFLAFNEKRRELVESNLCPCDACAAIDRLRLKTVVHHGEALLHRIGKFQELTGQEVILVHRLLKNSVLSDEYVLLTDSALQALDSCGLAPGEAFEETYDHLGTVKAHLHLHPLDGRGPALPFPPTAYNSPYCKVKNLLRRIALSRLMQLRLIRKPAFQHLP